MHIEAFSLASILLPIRPAKACIDRSNPIYGEEFLNRTARDVSARL
jgi:hypothetical protein